jgi:mRNA-degrading endonuclease RelE of RelBE toxin-antitoxin system
METEKDIRTLLFSNEFSEFLSGLDERTQDKFGDYLVILRKIYVLNAKIVKKLVHTDSLYELRISVGFNEYRAIIFSANHENIIQATELVVLNGFLKKGTKDYDKQIKRAIKILNTLEL